MTPGIYIDGVSKSSSEYRNLSYFTGKTDSDGWYKWYDLGYGTATTNGRRKNGYYYSGCSSDSERFIYAELLIECPLPTPEELPKVLENYPELLI